MDLNANTRIDDLLQEYPFLMEYLVSRSPKFKLLESAVMRKTVGKVATVAQAAAIGGIDPSTLLNDIAGEIRKRTGTDVVAGKEGMAVAPLKDADARQELLQATGKTQVPCLKIVGADGSVRWMQDSGAIIQYLQERFAS